MKVRSRVGVAVAAGAMVLGVTTLPAGAGIFFEPDVEVTGAATCNLATGHETYTLDWTVANTSSTPSGASSVQGTDVSTINIVSAVETGAWEGTVDGLVGATLTAPETATGSDGPVPNTSGTVTLTVTYTYGGGVEEGTATGTIDLDGECEADPTTTTSTTTGSTSTTAAPPAARALRVTPAFTG